MAKKKFKKDCRRCHGTGEYMRDSDPFSVEYADCDCDKGHNVYTEPQKGVDNG